MFGRESGSHAMSEKILFVTLGIALIAAIAVISVPGSDAGYEMDINWGDCNITYENDKLTIHGKRMDGNSKIFNTDKAPWNICKSEVKTIELYSVSFQHSQNAFANCPMLTTVVIGPGVKDLGIHTFYNCPNLSTLIINTETLKSTRSFTNTCSKSGGMDVTFGENVREIASNLFFTDGGGEAYIKSMTFLSKNIKKIPMNLCNSRFIGEELHFPDSVEEIESMAFEGASNLREVTFGENLKVIGSEAFKDCTAIDHLYLYDTSLKTIKEEAFMRCSSLQYMMLPPTLIEIQTRAFALTGLVCVNLDENESTVGMQAFLGCTNLHSLWVGEHVTFIGREAFRGCPINYLWFVESSEPISICALAFECYLLDKDGNPLYDYKDDFYGIYLRARFFMRCDGQSLMYDDDPGEWGGDEPSMDPINPPVLEAMFADGRLILSINESYATMSKTTVDAVKAAAAEGYSVTIRFIEGTITLDPESAMNIESGIQTAALRESSEGLDISRLVPIKDKDKWLPYDIKFGNTHTFGGLVTVSMKYLLEKDQDINNIEIWHLTEGGSEPVSFTYEDGSLVFNTNSLSQFVIVKKSSISNTTVMVTVGVVAVMAAAILVLNLIRKQKA